MENPIVDSPSPRVAEAILVLRHKDVRSTTLERVRLCVEADQHVRDLPQPMQLGEGVHHLLTHIPVPVSPLDLLVGRIDDEVPDADGEALFQQALTDWQGSSRPPWMKDSGHECFAWDRLLCLGLPGLEGFAASQLAHRSAAGQDPASLDFLRGAVRTYQALRTYARRYAEAAAQAGLESAAANCAALDRRAPETFAEALQLIWLVGHPYCTMLAANPTLTFGRLDELLLPFYRADVEAGRLTRDDAGDLIEDFYCKNNLILGRGEHQMGHGSEKDTGWARNLTYDAPQYIVLGGRRVDGGPVSDELTELFLERIVPRFENPVVVVRYTDDLPETTWRLVCDKMRANASMMVYSDTQVIPAMIACGIDPADAVGYTMHGCNWPDIPGMQRTTQTEFIILPEILRQTVIEDGPFHDTDGLYAALDLRLREQIDDGFARARAGRQSWDAQAPGRLRIDDCFLDGPVERSRSASLGGVRYPTIVCSLCGIGSAADGLAALAERLLPGQATPMDLRSALVDDFADAEPLRQRCLNAPKFGRDDPRADSHAVRLLDLATAAIDDASQLGTVSQVVAFRCLETDMRHIPFGRDLGATPDGRAASEPISENAGPVPGACRQGPTAMFGSVAKLARGRICSGALNVRMQPRHLAGEAGLDRLASLLRTYFELGGLQVQLSIADVAQLRDAQLHPEHHRDLMVRITGYSAAFVDMTQSAQDEIIRREEMGI